MQAWERTDSDSSPTK